MDEMNLNFFTSKHLDIRQVFYSQELEEVYYDNFFFESSIFYKSLQGSPTNTSSGLAAQRMHHNIPHRLQSQMVRRATNCAVCLDSIHFGRQVSTCQDCGASAHVKCTAHLPSTCGLPVGLAEHFDTVMGQENVSCIGETDSSGSFQMQGWVKIPRSAKGCWDRKYMKVTTAKKSNYL